MKKIEYAITPVAKPRMTQADKWKLRPACAKYWAFKDECRQMGVQVPDGSCIHFVIPFPKSWGPKRREQMLMQRHRQRPDIDNLVKALLDAVHEEDCIISEIHAIKVWGETGQIIVTQIRG